MHSLNIWTITPDPATPGPCFVSWLPQRYLRSAFNWVPWAYVHHPPTSFLLFHPVGAGAKAASWGGRQWDCHSAGRTFSEASVHLMRSSLGRKLGTPKASAHLQENDRCVEVWDRLLQIHREQGMGAELLPGETKPPYRRGRIQGVAPLPQELGLLTSLSLPFACLRYSVLIRTNQGKNDTDGKAALGTFISFGGGSLSREQGHSQGHTRHLHSPGLGQAS